VIWRWRIGISKSELNGMMIESFFVAHVCSLGACEYMMQKLFGVSVDFQGMAFPFACVSLTPCFVSIVDAAVDTLLAHNIIYIVCKQDKLFRWC
jgi:hypothetical protein